jgi:hypothetical protein
MRIAILAAAAALVFPVVVAAPVQAAERPAKAVCSIAANAKTYACLEVNARRVPAGKTATFTGTLSAPAFTALKRWTKGENVVCLTRYKRSPEADGSWPRTVLDGVCTEVRRDGSFTIEAEFGQKGTFVYGLEMGPCLASANLCGNGDPGLIGVVNKGKKVLTLRTT